MRRIAKGLQKFVIDNPAPFIVQVNHGFGVVTPYVMVNQHQNAGSKAEAPLHTVLTGNHHYLIALNLIQYHGVGANVDWAKYHNEIFSRLNNDEPLAVIAKSLGLPQGTLNYYVNRYR